ncbi:MAG TPA: pyruvate ferredoxin oxidoreductase [Spirochaetia bacterium]|nr:pyruvate ferredoxin oxidoreductase [Spirochaetia bacterium]
MATFFPLLRLIYCNFFKRLKEYDMIEITLIGRGGQGIVVAGDILAKALFYQGFFVKSFPAFGTERRGAPVKSFLRVSHERIKESYQIYKPDYYVIFDSIQANGLPLGVNGLVNAPEFKTIHHLNCLDANKIAVKNRLGSPTNPIINTTMLGGLAGLLEELDFHNLERAIQETLPAHLLKKNMDSAFQAYSEMNQKYGEERYWTLKCA